MRWRRAAAWLTAGPLMVAGSQVAHVLAFHIVYPQARVRLAALLSTGHGYMVGYPAFLPLAFGVLGGMVLVALSWTVSCDLRGAKHVTVPAWVFGLLPPLGFAIQEFLERWFSGAASPWQVVMEPTFQIGLALQIPFAIAAYLLTRLLSRVAATVVRVLRGAPRLRLEDLADLGWTVREVWPPRMAALANGHAGRGPPHLTASR